jgi:hypothetical protein
MELQVASLAAAYQKQPVHMLSLLAAISPSHPEPHLTEVLHNELCAIAHHAYTAFQGI